MGDNNRDHTTDEALELQDVVRDYLNEELPEEAWETWAHDASVGIRIFHGELKDGHQVSFSGVKDPAFDIVTTSIGNGETRLRVRPDYDRKVDEVVESILDNVSDREFEDQWPQEGGR